MGLSGARARENLQLPHLAKEAVIIWEEVLWPDVVQKPLEVVAVHPLLHHHPVADLGRFLHFRRLCKRGWWEEELSKVKTNKTFELQNLAF